VCSCLSLSLLTHRAEAVLLASDDASQAAYNDGWHQGDNGGSGFAPWSVIGQDNSTGSGGVFMSVGDGWVDISTGGKAFGVYGNGGGVGHAIRPFASDLTAGMTFAIDMDNQGVDPARTVGFSLRNAAGSNLAEFYFIGGQSNYTVNAANVSGSTPGWTEGGLRLAFTLTDADSFSLTIDEFSNGVGVDHTVVGELLAGGGDQSIDNFRLFNADGGPDVYFNNFAVSAIPEASAVAFFGLAIATTTIVVGIRRKFFAPPATS
jgi:hypothetical protein